MSPWVGLPFACAAFAAGVVIVFGIDRVILTRIARRMEGTFHS